MTTDLPELEDPGLWVECPALPGPPHPAFFADRDETLMPDTGYPRDPALVTVLPDLLPALREAMALNMPIVMITNQSGIARGILDWHQFKAVNDRLRELLRAEGVEIAGIVGCGYADSKDPVLNDLNHPMRKPAPGMLLLAAERMNLDVSRSIMIGDRATDVEAGERAGCAASFNISVGPEPVIAKLRELAGR